MKKSLTFTRAFYALLCTFLMITFVASMTPNKMVTLPNLVTGGLLGLGFSLFLIGTDTLFSRFKLRSFNTTCLGLFFGYLLGQAVLLIFNSFIGITSLQLSPVTERFIGVSIFLTTTYLGAIMTIRAAEELALCIPFIRLTPRTEKKRDILADQSVLGDVRVIDLANSGLLDHHLIIPRFVIRALNNDLDSSDDGIKSRARRSLETLKKLEGTAGLNLRFDDTEFPDARDSMEQVTKLARLLDANILTADINQVQQSGIEGVRIINIHTLANALKPVTQAGEFLEVKVQRYGKEPRQGVGYLEDGTMVVINGGGDFIGETIKAQVLSVKHTASGRMVFCNANEGNVPRPPVEPTATIDSRGPRGKEGSGKRK